MSNKQLPADKQKQEIEVRELAEQFFEEEINKLDDPQRKEEVEHEKETYIGVWMLGYRAAESNQQPGAVWVKASEYKTDKPVYRPYRRKREDEEHEYDYGEIYVTEDGGDIFLDVDNERTFESQHSEEWNDFEILEESGAAANELQQLRQWKKEAIQIINPIMEYAQGHKDAKLGGSCVDFILNRCKGFDELKSAVRVSDSVELIQYIRENYKPSKEVWKDKFGIALLSDEGVLSMYKQQKEK